MAQMTHNAKAGGDAEFTNVTITGTLTKNGTAVDTAVLLGSGQVVDLNGEADALVLDADADTTISAPTDDQIDFELKSVDHVVMKAVATADSGATTNIVEIALTTPVDTTGTNEHNALNIDIEIGNASGGTNTVNAIKIDNITGDAQVTETGILLGTGFDVGIDMQGTKIDLDAAGTTSIGASTNNQIDIEVNGAVDFVITANTFTASTGSTIVGQYRPATQELTATGAVTIANGTLYLNHATVAIVTAIAAPTAGDRILIVDSSASGTAAHVVTLTGATCNVTGNNTLTLNAPDESIELVASSATRWHIIANNNSVGLSTV